MKLKTPRDEAIAFIATYDTDDAGAYERHVVRIARTWLRIMNTTLPVQGIVDRIMEEFDTPETDDYGCGWDAIRRSFTKWAAAEVPCETSQTIAQPTGGTPGPQRDQHRIRRTPK